MLASLFLYSLKTSENQRFSCIFRRYRKRSVAWNSLIGLYFTNFDWIMQLICSWHIPWIFSQLTLLFPEKTSLEINYLIDSSKTMIRLSPLWENNCSRSTIKTLEQRLHVYCLLFYSWLWAGIYSYGREKYIIKLTSKNSLNFLSVLKVTIASLRSDTENRNGIVCSVLRLPSPSFECLN